MSGSDNTLKNIPGRNSLDYSTMDIPVRIAVYDNMKSIPRIIDLQFDDITSFINQTTQETYDLSHNAGGKIPFTIIKEIIENLIHADFNEITITILDNGNHIIISDQGPGIEDKEKAFLPGFTSATKKMKEYIRGVGSGFPIVKETITFSGGSIDVKDNIKSGTVISLKLESSDIDRRPGSSSNTIPGEQEPKKDLKPPSTADGSDKSSYKSLSERQKKILFVILELEEAGPSTIARELNLSLSTSYRELIQLEKSKLLITGKSGKRKLSKKGTKYLEYYSNSI
jgi:predicted HTH transcriptional regulator